VAEGSGVVSKILYLLSGSLGPIGSIAAVTTIPTPDDLLAIASGKGGVGNSSVTPNFAAALTQRGFAVGVIDADI